MLMMILFQRFLDHNFLTYCSTRTKGRFGAGFFLLGFRGVVLVIFDMISLDFMIKPLALSLIIPAYNEEQHLKACLDSILAQTVAPLEVIVVDNNSTDDTAKLAKKYPFVRVVTEKQQGIVFARNAGFNAANGDIIGRIDSDSILPIDWVEKVTAFYAETSYPEVAFTGCGYYYNSPVPRLSAYVLDFLAFRVNRVALGHHFLFGSNMAIQRKTWLKVKNKICVRNDIHEDIDIAIHIHELSIPIVYKRRFLVGVKLRRVFQDHDKLWGVLMLWPQSLRVHHKPFWFTGWIGAVLLYLLVPLIYPFKGLQVIHKKLAS